MCSLEKFPGTIMIGILRREYSFEIREFIIGPGPFSSIFAAKTNTLIPFSSSVRAINSLGRGDISDSSNPVIPVAKSTTPQISNVQAGDGKVVISWIPPDDDELIEKYIISSIKTGY